MKWLKKKPEDLKCGKTLLYMGAVGMLAFAPLFIVMKLDDITDWIKGKLPKKPDTED